MSRNAEERLAASRLRRWESAETEAARLEAEEAAIRERQAYLDARDVQRRTHATMRAQAPYLAEGRRLAHAALRLRRLRCEAWSTLFATKYGLRTVQNRYGYNENVYTIDAPREERDALTISRDAKERQRAEERSAEERFRAERYAAQQARADADAQARAIEQQRARAAWAAKRRNAAKGR